MGRAPVECSRVELIHYLKIFQGDHFLTEFHESPVTYDTFKENVSYVTGLSWNSVKK